MATKSSLPRRLKAAAMLLLCVALTATLLFSRLVGYADADSWQYIPLTQSNGITLVQTGTIGEDGVFHAESLYVPGRSPLLSGTIDKKIPFTFEGNKASWEGMTGIDLFRTNYGGSVVSANGENVIAPGTSSSYTFALENTARGNLDYAVNVTAKISPAGYHIPVEVKLTRDIGPKYLYGSANGYAPVEKLNASDSGVLGENKVMPYTLSWQWPFEGDNAHDTWLGTQDDVTLTIMIETYASYAPPTADAGGIPKTGDTSHIGMWFTVMLGSAAGLMFLLLLMRREGEKHETV